jgi:hypothetical protein
MNHLPSNIFALTPEQFQAHALLHNFEQNFRETNCYSDLVIEIVNGLGLNPIACLGYTIAADFEGDQWTFGKPSHHDLEALYGIRVEELSLYRPLVDQIVTQVQRGSIPLLEADAFHLPDTSGIDYRSNHVKTTIGITMIDVKKKYMHYFHNATFAKLEGEDFDGVMKPLASQHKGYLPPYCEMAKLDHVKLLSDAELRAIALESAKFHMHKRSTSNPMQKYADAITEHQQAIIDGGLPIYHSYTFVALRQLGSAHQLGGHFLRWLAENNSDLIAAAEAFEQISTLAKTLVLKLARVANSGKPADLTGVFAELSAFWVNADQHLKIAFQSL